MRVVYESIVEEMDRAILQADREKRTIKKFVLTVFELELFTDEICRKKAPGAYGVFTQMRNGLTATYKGITVEVKE